MTKRRSVQETAAAPAPSALDGGVATAAAALLALGIVMSYSATAPLALESTIPPHFLRHVAAAGAGVLCALLALRMPLRVWNRLALPVWGVALGLLLATAFLGHEVNGAKRWLALPGGNLLFQPAEIAKWATVLAVAATVSDRRGREEFSGRQAKRVLVLTLPPVALLLVQPDLGNAVLLSVTVGILLIAAGFPIRRLLLPSAVGALGFALYVATQPYAWRRVTGFLSPWERAHSEGFQLVQSFVAFAQGGLTGTGLGNARQKLFYLPEAHTDFILSLVAEELGLLGVLFVLAAFAGLWIAGVRIAREAGSRYGLLLALAMTLLLTLPAILNAAVAMGLVPTKGLTLPFLSYGRTSLIVTCLSVGVLLGVARESGRPGPRRRRAA
ncbi:MAG: putative lipid II flippase FtsW [Proteobacteria bacterium]|nr:putative lipid II flippase FtsW [Pseudomonadota bacterium]